MIAALEIKTERTSGITSGSEKKGEVDGPALDENGAGMSHQGKHYEPGPLPLKKRR